MKTPKLLDCALIGACAVIRPNTVYRQMDVRSDLGIHSSKKMFIIQEKKGNNSIDRIWIELKTSRPRGRTFLNCDSIDPGLLLSVFTSCTSQFE